MSSFVVSAKFMKETAGRLLNLKSFHSPDQLGGMLPYPLMKSRTESVIAKKLMEEFLIPIYKLNIECVCIQYRIDDTQDEYHDYMRDFLEFSQFTPGKYKGSNTKILYDNKSYLETHKALSCIGYQTELARLENVRDLTIEEENSLEYMKEVKENLLYAYAAKKGEYDNTNGWGSYS